MMNNNIFSAIVVKMNQLDDVQGAQILSIIDGMISSPSEVPSKPVATPKPSKGLTLDPEKPVKPPMRGKEYWGSDNSWVSVRIYEPKEDDDPIWIVYINVPSLVRSKDDNGDTKKAKARAQYIRDQIKQSAKSYGAAWAGNFDAGQIYWAFETKEDADEFIKDQIDKNKKRG